MGARKERKMRRVALILGVVVAVAVMSGCGAVVAFAPVVPPTGAFFTATEAPLDVDVDKTQLGSKTGKASTHCVFGLVAFGDGSIATAARNGNLKVINHADYSSLNVLGFYSSYTTIVYGD